MRRGPRSSIAVVLVGLVAGAAQAAESGADPAPGQVRSMTLGQAIAYARAHQPAVLAARARVGASRADADVPRAQWLPRVGATAQLLAATGNNSTASYYGTAYVPLPRIGATRTARSPDWTPYPSTLVALGAGQEVYDFGRIAAQAAVADARLEVERQRSEVTRLEVDFAVREAFYAVQAARAVLAAARQALARAQVHRDWARAGVRGGLRSPIELTRAEADLSRFQVGVIRAEGGLRAARSAFAAAVGVIDLELDATGASQAFPPVPSLRQALDAAAAHDPALKAALWRIREQEAHTRAVHALLRPELLLAASVSVREGGAPPSSGDSARFSGWLPDVPNFNVGLVLSWPLYDGTVVATARASRAREAVRRAELGVQQQEQITAVQRAHVDAEVAHGALVGLTRARDAALANYDQAEARFRAGLGNAVELADAEALRTEAEINLALGRFAVWHASVALARLTGEAL